jgi:purine-binding chemotaxis protein CheW
MKNDQIIKKIGTVAKTKVRETVKYGKYVIFTCGKEAYAIEAAGVKEIVHDLNIYPLPFMPFYVTGLINRYGQPHTVIDLGLLIFSVKSESDTFLILNRGQDSVCLHCDDILEIGKIPSNEILSLESTELDYVSGTFNRKNRNIQILQIGSILEKLGNDISA